jgi:NAD(P) transhydrogenase subunit alpha
VPEEGVRGGTWFPHATEPEAREADQGLSAELIFSLTIFALAVFLGFELISRVPTLLHTPLMSGTNAIHGIVLVGAMLIAGSADSALEQSLAFVAVVFGTINVIGGFLVTDRMLEMFKRKPPERDDAVP